MPVQRRPARRCKPSSRPWCGPLHAVSPREDFPSSTHAKGFHRAVSSCTLVNLAKVEKESYGTSTTLSCYGELRGKGRRQPVLIRMPEEGARLPSYSV